MSVYIIEIRVECLVEADDPSAAVAIAEMNCREILDDNDPEVDYCGQIKSLASLPSPWKPFDSVYGAHGNDKLLSQILPDQDPFVDTKTIDMFTGQPWRPS